MAKKKQEEEIKVATPEVKKLDTETVKVHYIAHIATPVRNKKPGDTEIISIELAKRYEADGVVKVLWES